MAYDQRNDRGGNYDDRRAPPRRDQRNYQNEFPNSGSMHIREKRSDKAPDMGGDFTITGEVLDYVLREAQRGGEVKLEVSAWKRMSRNNTTFLSLAINTPYEYRQRNQNPGYRGGYPSRGGPRQTVPSRQGDFLENDNRRGYAEQSGRGRSNDMPDFMRDDDNRQEPDRDRGGYDRELNDEIPF